MRESKIEGLIQRGVREEVYMRDIQKERGKERERVRERERCV